jgi:hypothetical protein
MLASIAAGSALSRAIELPVFQVRDRLFPKKGQSPSSRILLHPRTVRAANVLAPASIVVL